MPRRDRSARATLYCADAIVEELVGLGAIKNKIMIMKKRHQRINNDRLRNKEIYIYIYILLFKRAAALIIRTNVLPAPLNSHIAISGEKK